MTSCENQSIQAPQKAKMDFDIVNQAFDIELAMKLVEDKTGKKASLHECSDTTPQCVFVRFGEAGTLITDVQCRRRIGTNLYAQACRTDVAGPASWTKGL